MCVIETETGWRLDKYDIAYFIKRRRVFYIIILGRHIRFEGSEEDACGVVRTELKRLGFSVVEIEGGPKLDEIYRL
jgi:hypothetical protein